MRSLTTLIFCLLLPVLLVLGHDIYIAYEKSEGDTAAILNNLQFSDIGWLWQRYAPDSYNQALDTIDPRTMKTWIAPLLEQTALLVTGILAGCAAGLLYLVEFFKAGGMSLRLRPPPRDKKDVILSPKRNKMKYKRK